MKKLEDYVKTKPQQLELFELLGPKNRDYSNTIELYDFAPKYKWGKVTRINGKYLNALERSFEFNGQKYKLRITPANIRNSKGEEKYYYPGQREELVEDALRKLACEGHGVFMDDLASVTFTLYQLEKELAARGHRYKRSEIKEALQICNKTGLDIETDCGTVVLSSHIFETVILSGRDDDESGNKTRCLVRFNPLVTTSIKNNSFRMVNYDKAMSIKSVIARQLHKRMSHQYKQASCSSPYHILLSTMIRDFGLTPYTDLRNNLRDVLQALEELKEKQVILQYEATKTIDVENRNRLSDTKFTITPSVEFVKNAIMANEQQAHNNAVIELRAESKRKSARSLPRNMRD